MGLVGFLREGDQIVLPELLSSVETRVQRRVRVVEVKRRRMVNGKRRTVKIQERLVETRTVFVDVLKLVITGDGRPWREFHVRNHTRAMMVELVRREKSKGATWSHAPSQDQRELLSDAEKAAAGVA